MQPKSKEFRALTGALLAAALLAGGCKRPAPPPPPRALPHAGRTVRVACPSDAAAAVVAQHGGNGWGQREGAKVEVLRYEPGTEPPEADAWVIAPAELGCWAVAGQLRPVPESYLKDDRYAWNRLLIDYRDALLLWDRKPCALPLLGESPLCFYRADLFDSRAHQEEFEKKHQRKLAAPTTWEEYADVAAFFAGRQADGGPLLLPPLPERDEDFDRLFYSVAASFARRAIRAGSESYNDRKFEVENLSFHYDLDTGQARIDTPGFVRALQLLQQLQSSRAKGTHRDPPQLFADGGAALCLADASWIHRFQQGPVRDRFGVCRLPGAGCYYSYRQGEPVPVSGGNWVPYLGAGGWIAVVPRQSAQPEAAFALLADLSGPDTSRQIVHDPRWGGGAFRTDHLNKLAGWSNLGLPPARSQALLDSLNQTLDHPGLWNPAYRLRTPDERAHLRALAEVLRPALLEGKDASAALGEVAQRWRELDGRTDPKARLAEYRLSLGFRDRPDK
jgi:ABC-type glycerol-3-phosphate transport system substrate-binding protein